MQASRMERRFSGCQERAVSCFLEPARILVGTRSVSLLAGKSESLNAGNKEISIS
jgi:hypothetical protein